MTPPITRAPALRIPRFKTSRHGVCGSEYRCEDFEIGDRVGVLATPAGPVNLCEPCCERTEAAAELAAIDPTAPGREHDDAPPAPTNVAEALEALRTEHDVHGQYPEESVARLIALIDPASEQVAVHERERWHTAIRNAARRAVGGALTPDAIAGLHMAASMIQRNREHL